MTYEIFTMIRMNRLPLNIMLNKTRLKLSVTIKHNKATIGMINKNIRPRTNKILDIIPNVLTFFICA